MSSWQTYSPQVAASNHALISEVRVKDKRGCFASSFAACSSIDSPADKQDES